jgi:flagellin
MRVNQNLFARNAQRNLFDTNNRLSKSIEKLSSGLRINRAADDAAGLAVSETLRAQVSGLGVSVSNAQDGISLIQTAEGGLDRVHAILRRVRDLTGYSANGDKTDTDRVNYQAEVDQLLDEVDRISKTTEYNTKKLLNGQIGATANEAADVDGVLQADKVNVNGLVAQSGEYKFEFQQYATKATATIGGASIAVASSVTDVNKAGSFSDFLVGTDNMTAAQEGTYSYKVQSEDKEVIVSLEAKLNAGDTMQDAINKFNKAFEDAGMNLTASYNSDYNLNTADNQMGIQITSNEFGSKHDIKVSIASEPGNGGNGLYLSAGSDTNIRNVGSAGYGLINSDLSTVKGELSRDTEIVASTAASNENAIYDTADTQTFRITTRSGGSVSYQLSAGATMQNLVDTINDFAGAGGASILGSSNVAAGDLTAIFDEKTGSFKIIDNTTPTGTNTFKIDNGSDAATSSVIGVASQLGIYGETTGGEVQGVRVSNTRDYILDVTDPSNTGGVLMGNYGDRSTHFEGVNSLSSVVSSGIDPDRNGPELAGSGGIAGISFTLEEKQLDETNGQNRFSILAKMGSLTFQIGPNEGNDHRLSVSVGDMSSKALNIADLDISTQTKAQELIDSGKLDEAINKVSLQRGALGAVQNRLDHTIKNLSVTKENLQAGESRIRDVDVADETLEFTRNQILSQAGTAMLAQANQIPQGVMQLLG